MATVWMESEKNMKLRQNLPRLRIDAPVQPAPRQQKNQLKRRRQEDTESFENCTKRQKVINAEAEKAKRQVELLQRQVLECKARETRKNANKLLKPAPDRFLVKLEEYVAQAAAIYIPHPSKDKRPMLSTRNRAKVPPVRGLDVANLVTHWLDEWLPKAPDYLLPHQKVQLERAQRSKPYFETYNYALGLAATHCHPAAGPGCLRCGETWRCHDPSSQVPGRNLPNRAVQLECGHVFCTLCLKNEIQDQFFKYHRMHDESAMWTSAMPWRACCPEGCGFQIGLVYHQGYWWLKTLGMQ